MKKTAFKTGLQIVIISLLCYSCFTACKKSNSAQPKNDSTSNTAGLSQEDSLKYYIYHYMQVTLFSYGDTANYPEIPLYYWYSQVPTLNPLSSSYDSAEDLLNSIISYPKNPQTGGQIDRYSFLDRTGAETNLLQNGLGGDMGFQPEYAYDNNNNLVLVVIYVYGNSSAGLQGVQRGWEITAVNGNTDISNSTMVENALYNSPSAQFTFQEPNGSQVTLTINVTDYSVDPVLFDTVYTLTSGAKVGYFVFNQFIDIYTYDSLGNVTGYSDTYNELNNVFTKFQDSGVNDVIVDLRYNGGGSVNTAEYIDDQLAPSSAANQLMYNLDYNDKMTTYESQLGLQTQVDFGTTGPFNLSHVFFITTNNTASASELTLNNLAPYMDVQTVGDTTYGKPCEDFDWPITDYISGQLQYLADLFVVIGHTSNAAGNGSYYQGIPPDHFEYDYIGYNWGDPNDPNLQDIFNFINNGGVYRTSNLRLANPTTNGAFRAAPGSFNINKPKVMSNFQLNKKLYYDLKKGLLKKLIK
jgi:carboxyl-terminal processing protease